MRIKPSTDTPSTQPHSSQSPMPIDDHAMLQSRFERALKENPDQTKPQPNETNNQAALEAKKPFTENYSERSLASLHSTSQSKTLTDDHVTLQSRFKRALNENPDKPLPNEANNQAALEAKKPFTENYSERSLASPHSTGSNQRKTAEKSAFAQNNDVVTENINNESDTSSPIALNTQDKTPSDMDAHMKSDIRIPTTGDKKLPMEPSNKREKNADEQDAFERLVEDHDDSKTELATAKTAEPHESTQSPKDTKNIPTAGTKPNTVETVSDALASTLASTTVASATSASLASHPVTSTVHKTATKTEVNKHEGDSSLGFNSRNLKTPIPNDEHPKASKGERTLLDRAMLDSEKSSDKPMHQPVTTPITQGDVILKGISTPQPTQPTREVSQLIQQLVDKMYVALPTASNEKEVRLFLSEGQLKGGEIHIKLDSQGYSVTIRQEHALSIINQQARQDLAERLNRMGFEQPLRVSISEQTSQHGHTQQDQQQSRQQRSVYEEWQPEADQ
ncbi:type III secretion system needle length determinant [Vibrio parahaemolyticus]|uniref:type III secretion system needle length determinant n=1 Tax=Vibrio parahaemolyticus TaxID=670 RepID=UPI0007A0C7EE|nr:type III secretion system needle length determinant [Vibrio parahaemolyticus]KYY18796.1 translocation protein in type III secretion [Vibrio parahaemolyticus]